MHPREPTDTPTPRAARPRWSVVLRAVREARGVTLEGWAARIGVSRATVQRWEAGTRAPDPAAEAAILVYCRDTGLLRSYDRGPLAGLSLTAELLQALLAEARWRGSGVPAGAADRVPGSDPAAPADREDAQPRPPEPPPSNLPAQLTSFVGRERELAEVRRVQAGTRLLTLTGAGGCGKTRLTLELARELVWAYPHGAWLVELAALADPALVPQTVAVALGLPPAGMRPPMAEVAEFLRGRHLLLMLDNCEHLLPACAELVETLLRACPHLEVIANSREPLGIGGETVWRVPPMSLPDGGDTRQGPSNSNAEPAATDAVRLFVERARLQRPELVLTPGEEAAVAEICRRLDGMPLAIELAAARVRVLSIAQIAERLHDRFRLLTDGSRTAMPRHQTLRAAMEWSHDLLSAPEQALLRGLSVFAGGFTLAAAEEVAGPESSVQSPVSNSEQRTLDSGRSTLDWLVQLVDKSLVIAERQEEAVRYRMLETVRQYAAEKLEDAAKAAIMRDRHRAWCLALAEAADAEMYGPREVEWLTRLEREHDNVRAALAWSLTQGERAGPQALRLAAALAHFWNQRGHASEGRRWLAQALAMEGTGSAAERARALRGTGTLAGSQGDFVAADALFTESLLLCRELGDDDGIAEAEVNLGRIAFRQGEYAIAGTLLGASLARGAERGNRPVMATAQTVLGLIALRQGDLDRARAALEASLAIQRARGNKQGIAGNLNDLATLASEEGDDQRQAAALAESLALYRELGNRSGIALTLGDFAVMAWLRREYDRAAALMQESLTLYRELGEQANIARVLGYQGLAALYRRDYAEAETRCRECLTLYRETGDIWGIGRNMPVMAGVMFGQGQAERAARLFGAAAALRKRLGTPLPRAIRSGHDRAVAATRAALGEQAFESAWAAGQALSAEEATAEALSARA